MAHFCGHDVNGSRFDCLQFEQFRAPCVAEATRLNPLRRAYNRPHTI